MDWDKLKTFHAAAEARSLTGAAETLNLSQSAVSRQISALEDSLGVKLFHRHTRGLLLTEPGRVLFEAAGEIAGRVALAEGAVQDVRDEPSGLLRVTAPTALGSIWLAPRLARFHEAYPNIRLRLLLTDHELDIARLEADVAIRPWAPTQKDVIQRKLMDASQHLYAAPSYLARKGTPQSEGDLDAHAFIAYGPRHLAPIPQLGWPLALGRAGKAPREPVAEVNTIKGVMRLCEAGIGIAGLPAYVARENPNLEVVLPEVSGPDFETYLIYPEELRGSRRVAAFASFVIEEARRWQD
ncbi:LysR family transcriptional regulator [Alkalicaulis satelles]|uniref:LysR family transcriptional regulator n=1 Tax=Alkalicaulis satelles TaxID=2609175 RepID=A0A5M6ZHJ0_9PROT|nr:LysR family transcriptional regulator [Alkalicaulis satelles]KAA5803760.1 LysR family transcriptional regulator [Alkalicaulis satelles]